MVRRGICALPLLLAVGCAGAEPVGSSSPPVEAPVAEAPSPPVVAASFSGVLAKHDARIATARAQADAMPADWSRAGRLASLLQQRFRLSSDLSDLLAAERVLAEAFRAAVPGGGPWAARAALSASLHDLHAAEDAHQRVLKRPLLSASDRATALRGLADVALARGEVDVARAHLEAARLQSDDVSQSCAEARLAELTESAAAADAHLAAASKRLLQDTGEPAAWVALQRARLALSGGKLSVAEAHLHTAERALPGWWATAALSAELALARGDRPAALQALTAATEGTPHPEYAARRAILLAETDLLTAEGSMSKARARMAEWSALAPAAMATHAAELALAEGEAARALSLARQHADTHADAAALVLLARSAGAAGQASVADDAMTRLKVGGWSVDHVADLCAGGGCAR